MHDVSYIAENDREFLILLPLLPSVAHRIGTSING